MRDLFSYLLGVGMGAACSYLIASYSCKNAPVCLAVTAWILSTIILVIWL